jgi:hypothetical protein
VPSAILANRVRVNSATTGTGTLTLGGAFSNAFCTFAEAGVANGQTVTYCIEEGLDFEIGRGVYTSSGTTLSRATVLLSKIAGTAGTSKMNLLGAETVRIIVAKEDLDVNDFDEDAAPDSAADFVWTHDTSATLKKKVKPKNFLAATNGAAPGMFNGTVVESHASNAATFAVKTLAGADPSGTDPVVFVFPTTTGGYVVRTVTAALSITVSSGSTLGVANSTKFKLHLCVFDDAGTVRLGVQQTDYWLSGGSTGGGPLGPTTPFIKSSLAEGGAGAADFGGIWYTGTAVTTKTFIVIGVIEYQSGLATAGTWTVSPDVLGLWSPGMPLPMTGGEVFWRDTTGKASVRNMLNLSNTADTNATLNVDTVFGAGVIPMYATGLILTVEKGYSTTPATPGKVVQLRVMPDGYNLGAVLDRDKGQQVFDTNIGGLDVVASHVTMPICPARRQFFYALQSNDAASANKLALIDCWGYKV